MADDPIKAPAYYAGREHEPIDVTTEWAGNWPPNVAQHIGNAIKYLARLGLKGDPIQDLRKAIQYLLWVLAWYETGSIRGRMYEIVDAKLDTPLGSGGKP